MKEYPTREIFRKRGNYAMCQVMTPWTHNPPKYIACNDLERGDQFVAHQALGTWAEVDIINFVNGVNDVIVSASRLLKAADRSSCDSLICDNMRRALVVSGNGHPAEPFEDNYKPPSNLKQVQAASTLDDEWTRLRVLCHLILAAKDAPDPVECSRHAFDVLKANIGAYHILRLLDAAEGKKGEPT